MPDRPTTPAPTRPGDTVARPTREDELSWVLEREHAPENAPYVVAWTRERHVEAIRSPDEAHLLVEDSTSGARIGYLILRGLRSEERSLELVRIVAHPHGRGRGRRALRWVLHHAFATLGFRRIWLDVLEDNARARALYVSEGFREETVLPDAVVIDGRPRTLVVLSRVRGGRGAETTPRGP